ncbi:MAG: lytic transglycosylase domain-containing protein [Bacteroidales bacterium]|jgi:membrane-bound lytic murein transglycosylase D|nr:lytic transglycosylase domain-containing protein [Bacteroidales bacterium]MDD2688061.1 lytic transglycosylase domain-containing protein [Bacteroidales bacterium]MDD3331058.1 lytic transglycosylase domain-containing protein [Bacteroidales bacterium]MDD3691348.1 lytic transglycosylase domain-containing protein [Bacteroidales bacterium]MDD4045251.1 lytic transglycosylase domain-containing protein [Bacteroidales bacterium]
MKRKYIFLSILPLVSAMIIAFVFWCHTKEQQAQNEDYYKAFRDNYALYSPPIPESLSFAGEKVPLDVYYVREALDKELLVNVYWQSNILLLVKRAARYFPVIEPILKANNIPEDFKYLAVIESGLTNAVSPANAAGIWQFIKSTGLHYQLEINTEVDERYHLTKATQAACQYLKNSYRMHGSWTAAAAAYNMGDGGFRRCSTSQQTNQYWDLFLNAETARYVYRILAIKLIFENPQKYGVKLRLKDLYPPIPTHTLTVDTSIANLMDFARQQGVNYKVFKECNPWLIAHSLNNKSHKSYQIEIPDSKYMRYYALMEGVSSDSLYCGEK